MDDLAIMAIVQQIRKQDYRGDFYLSNEECMQLINDFGRQEYLRAQNKYEVRHFDVLSRSCS